jgi:hypothetical protein
LSQASRIAFEISASNGGLAESIGIYFGTPNGWYAHEGSVWILAVNTGSSTHDAHLALTVAIDDFEMPFEGRRVKATSGRWQDEFGPYERHVYKTNLATRGRR